MAEFKRVRSRKISWRSRTVTGLSAQVGNPGTDPYLTESGAYRLSLREGVAITKIMETGMTSEDVLSEGFPERTAGAEHLAAFRRLRRIGWLALSEVKNALSHLGTVKLPWFEASVDYTEVNNILTMAGFVPSSNGDGSWLWAGEWAERPPLTDPSYTSEYDKLMQISLAKLNAHQEMIAGSTRRAGRARIEWKYCTLYGTTSSTGALPSTASPAVLTTVPTDIGVDSSAMAAARFRASESLHRGGQAVLSQNKLKAILELKDIPRSCSQLVEFAAFVAKVGKHSPKNVVLMSAGQLASGYLFWKFGVQPTIDDVNRWWGDTIQSKAISVLNPAEGLIHEGQTIRAAYSVTDDEVVDEKESFKFDSFAQTRNMTQILGTTNPPGLYCRVSLWEMLQSVPGRYRVPLKFEPRIAWSHKGVMFGRAFDPVRENMPDWLRSLVPEEDTNSPTAGQIGHYSDGQLYLMANPPVKTAWQLLGWSWLVDWFGNVGETLDRLAGKAFPFLKPVRIVFKELWACDRWVRSGYFPRPSLAVSQLNAYVTHGSVSFTARVGSHPDPRVYSWRPEVKVQIFAKASEGGYYPPQLRVESTLRWGIRSVKIPTVSQVVVERAPIPTPRIPPVTWEVKGGVSKLIILGTLTLQRITGLRNALMIRSAKVPRNIKTPTMAQLKAAMHFMQERFQL